MDTFRAVTLTAGFISIVIAIFDSIYPSEKYSKQVKMIFSLIFVISVITPFANGEVNFSETTDSIAASSDELHLNGEAADTYFVKSIENNISRNISEYLKEKEISFTEIKTSINISDSGSISINEIEIAVDYTAQEDEIIALVKNKIEQDALIKIKENVQYEYAGAVE